MTRLIDPQLKKIGTSTTKWEIWETRYSLEVPIVTKLRVAVAVAASALALSMIGIALASSSARDDRTALNKVHPEIEQRQAQNGMRFTEVVQTAEARVSADEAKAKALEVAAPWLERPATSLDVKLVRFSHDKNGPDGKPLAQDRLAWKITFYGTRTKGEGPMGRSQSNAVDLAVLDQSVTWVLIDAITGETVATYSASP